MLLYVYLFTQIFLQAAAAFEPISLDFNRVKDVKNVKRDEVSRRYNRGDIESRGIVDVDTINDLSDAYSVYLSVGSNNDVVEVALDFSTSDLTVLSPDLDYWYTGSLNYSQSTSFKQNETSYSQASYLMNSSGFWGQDDITIGNTTIKGLDLVVLNFTNSNAGVLGLGLPEWESTYENASNPHMYENLPMKLKSQGSISKVAYSVYHHPWTYYDHLYDTTYDTMNGTLLFGAVDHAKYSGNLTTLPMIEYNSTGHDSEWLDTERRFQVLLHGMKFGGNVTDDEDEIITISNDTYYAAIFPTYKESFFPKPIVDAIAAALGGSKSLADNYTWNVPCVDDERIVFLFDFGDITLRVPAISLVRGFLTDCSLSVGATRNDDDFILLGENVMQYAYCVYDLEDREVSIAQVKVRDRNDIQEIVSSVPGAIRGSTQTTIGSIATESKKSSESSSTIGKTQPSTQTTSDGTTTEPKKSSLSTSKTSASSDASSQRNSSTSKAVSLAWLMVSCLFASLLVIM